MAVRLNRADRHKHIYAPLAKSPSYRRNVGGIPDGQTQSVEHVVSRVLRSHDPITDVPSSIMADHRPLAAGSLPVPSVTTACEDSGPPPDRPEYWSSVISAPVARSPTGVTALRFVTPVTSPLFSSKCQIESWPFQRRCALPDFAIALAPLEPGPFLVVHPDADANILTHGIAGHTGHRQTCRR